jgi:hypothetical protein
MYRVDPNPFQRTRIRPRPHQADDAVLGRDVTITPGFPSAIAPQRPAVELVMTIAPPRPPSRIGGDAGAADPLVFQPE